MEIKNLTKEQLNEAAQIFVEAFNSVDEMWNFETALARLESSFDPEFYFGAFIDETMVGMVAAKVEYEVDHKALCIDIFAVSPVQQGKGIGKLLLYKTSEVAKEKGFNNIWLLASTKLPSFDFYKKDGFIQSHWGVVYKNL
jgi:aminoglycoside 6'-N-acetyltransferase I